MVTSLKCESPARRPGFGMDGTGERSASETPGADEAQCFAMMRQRLPIEVMAHHRDAPDRGEPAS
jgi:hypothetical protein